MAALSLRVAVVLAAFAIAGLTAGAARAEKRVALVIGNSTYQHVTRLENPANDARQMAETLRSLGFLLVGNGPQLDLDEARFRRAVQDFGSALTGADVALFYYAGHGVQVRGGNYLVPVGANPVREADVDFQMLDASLVLRQMESAGTKLNLIILDACRNNPFGGRGLRATGSGLAQMQAPQGTLISFATQPGNVALDGNDGNSPYTKALVQAIKKPGLDIFRTFNEVGLAVASATGGAQQPWVSLSPIKGDFYFTAASSSDEAERRRRLAQEEAERKTRAAQELERELDRQRQAALDAEQRRRAAEDELSRHRRATEDAERRRREIAEEAERQRRAAEEEAQRQRNAPKKLANLTATPTQVGTFGDWGVYAAAPNGRKVCYALSKPMRSDRATRAAREATYLLISSRPDDQVKNEISVILGYTAQANSAASLELGSTKIALHVRGDSAWVQTVTDEMRMIEALRRENAAVVVKSTSSQGRTFTDTYSLRGVDRAITRALQECF